MKHWFQQILLPLFLLALITANAQKHDFAWLMGYNSENPIGYEGMVLNFNEMPPEVAPFPITANLYISSASISDKNGSPAFYTDGELS